MSMISKQIDDLRAYAKDRKGELAKLVSDAADTIEMLSAKLSAANMERSARYYHGGWIPCSERLPELNRPLLVTAYHRVYYGHLISESGNYGYPVFRIHGLGDKNRDWVQETMSHGPYSLGRIDAWRYLDIPEPYKAESEEKE